MKRFVIGLLALGNAVMVGLAPGAERDLAAEVRAAERAFAKTMATRDLKSFSGYVSEEGVFFGG